MVLLRQMADAASVVDALSLIFQLGLASLDGAVDIHTLSPFQLQLLDHLREIGLVHGVVGRGAKRSFFATPLSVLLVHGAAESATSNAAAEQFVIVETNFHVYAYDASDIKLALLTLFVELHCHLPHMTVALLTRESVSRALNRGITAAQIIHFLQVTCACVCVVVGLSSQFCRRQVYAHAEMYGNTECQYFPLPRTISDQVVLWEQERTRVRTDPGVYYDSFATAVDYDAVKRVALEHSALLWHNDKACAMVVNLDGHTAVRAFQQRRAQAHLQSHI
jgi:transcription initiation factor TFIIH subunit 4